MDDAKDEVDFSDDLLLAQRAVAMDARARRDVVTRLLKPVQRIVYGLVRDDSEADDWVQESLIEVIKSLKNYRGETKLEYWSKRIVVRTTLRKVKARRSRDSLVTPQDELPEMRDERPNPQTMLRRRLNHHLSKLSPEQSEALTLKLIHGYSVEEVAKLTDAKVNTVRGRLRNGRALLREQLLADPILREWAARNLR